MQQVPEVAALVPFTMDFMKMFKFRAELPREEPPAGRIPPLDIGSLELVDGVGPALSSEYQSNEIDFYGFLVKWDGHYSLEGETPDSVIQKVKALKEMVWALPMYSEENQRNDGGPKWYKLWDVSSATDIKISELYWCSDIVLFRYLRSYKYNVNMAFQMLTKTIAWRRLRGIDSISPDTVGRSNKEGMLYRKGYDNTGRPVIYFRPLNEVDTDRENQVLLMFYTMERTMHTALLDHGNDKVFVIIDLKGWSLSKLPTMETVIDTVRAFSEHFTDVLQEVLIVDPPMLMDPLLQMVKAVLDTSTSKKIIIKQRGSKLEAYLKSRIHVNYVEESMGGNNKTEYDHSVYWENEKNEFLRQQQRRTYWIQQNEDEWINSHNNDDPKQGTPKEEEVAAE